MLPSESGEDHAQEKKNPFYDIDLLLLSWEVIEIRSGYRLICHFAQRGDVVA
jgi:hypothetical protein